ncbi:hypothetical protein F5887DRAFT_1078938 [Amanita rubescens]|nr:hypothetical protein F5887DRAFT_1078938 [Amanita rubescens]
MRVKTFDFVFAATRDNYALFLNTILKKHDVNTKVDATDTLVFSCKFHVPPAKVSDACDVDRFSEYEEVVKQILERKSMKGITVTARKNDAVTALRSKKTKKKGMTESDDGDNEDSQDEATDDDNNTGLTRIDAELARLRKILETKYANDHGSGFAYIDSSSGELVPLTPFMMKEWARAMYDGKVTASEPPQTATFDMVNRKPSLRSCSMSSMSTSTSSSGSGPSDIAHLSNILSYFAGGILAPTQPTPTTPKHGSVISATPDKTVSPPTNTPSKLTHFLEFAQTKLGVANAPDYEARLRLKGYGPDILHRVGHDALTDLGITPGDAIRLQDNAPKWWNSTDAKRKHPSSITEDSDAINRTPPNKRVRFEKHYHDGGKSILWGSRLVSGNFTNNEGDFTWHYHSYEHDAVIPVPPGYLPVFEGSDDD